MGCERALTNPDDTQKTTPSAREIKENNESKVELRELQGAQDAQSPAADRPDGLQAPDDERDRDHASHARGRRETKFIFISADTSVQEEALKARP